MIVTRSYALEPAPVPGEDVVLARVAMGGLTVHASALALTGLAAGTAAARRGLDASAVFADAARIVDFSGYYLCGPGNPGYEGHAGGPVGVVGWDSTREAFLPPAPGDWRPWPWPPGTDPPVLLVHSDGAAMGIVVGDHEEYYPPRAVGAWARHSGDLGLGARPLADPLVVLGCAGARSSQAVADEVGRLVWSPTGDVTIGASAISLADKSAGVRVGVTLYPAEDGRAGRFGSAYPQGPAGDRVRWACGERFGNGDAGWIAERLAAPGLPPPQTIRPRQIEAAGRVFGWCYFDERDFNSRQAALTPAAVSPGYVSWVPNHAYRPGTPRTPDPRTGKITADAEPWHAREQGTLPFRPGEVIFVAVHFARGHFVVTDPQDNLSYLESPRDFSLRLRRDYHAAQLAQTTQGRALPRTIVLLTDHEPVPPQAVSLLAQTMPDAEFITASLPATMFRDDHPATGTPHTRVALIPASGDTTTTPAWTKTSASGTVTLLPPIYGSDGPARPVQRAFEHVDLPPSATRRPALAEAYRRTGNRGAKAQDVAGEPAVARLPGAGPVSPDRLAHLAAQAGYSARFGLTLQAKAPGPRPGREWDRYCKMMLDHLIGDLFPHGVILGGKVREDGEIPAAGSGFWAGVGTWTAFLEEVRDKPGRAGRVKILRPGQIGHEILLVHTTDPGTGEQDIVLINPTTPGSVSPFTTWPATIGAGGGQRPARTDAARTDAARAGWLTEQFPLIDASALLIAADSRAIHAIHRRPAQPGVTARALTDPPVSHTGAPPSPRQRGSGPAGDDPQTARQAPGYSRRTPYAPQQDPRTYEQPPHGFVPVFTQSVFRALPGDDTELEPSEQRLFSGDLETVLTSEELNAELGAPEPIRLIGPANAPPVLGVPWSGTGQKMPGLTDATEDTGVRRGVVFLDELYDEPEALPDTEDVVLPSDGRRTSSGPKVSLRRSKRTDSLRRRRSSGSGSRRSSGSGSRQGSLDPESTSGIPRGAVTYDPPLESLRVPWAVPEGALGEMEVMAVLPEGQNQEGREANAHADLIAFTGCHGNTIRNSLGRAGAEEVEAQLAEVLASGDLEEWTEALQVGSTSTVHGQTVWIRYRLTDPKVRGALKLPSRQARFGVSFSAQQVQQDRKTGGEVGIEEALDVVATVGSAALSSLSGLAPSLATKTTRERSWGVHSRVVGGRKLRVQNYQPFDMQLAVEIYVDGQDLLGGAQLLTAERHLLTVGFQVGLVGKDEDKPNFEALSPVDLTQLRHFDLVLNAAGISQAIPPMIMALRDAGLSANSTTAVARQVIRQLVNEQSVLNRSHGIPGRIVSKPFSVPHRLGTFSGTATLVLQPTALTYWRAFEGQTALRYDIGWEGQLARGRAGMSGLSVRSGAELIKLRVPGLATAGYLGISGSLSHSRGASSTTGLDHGSKTTLQWGGKLDLFAGRATAMITFQANVTVAPVTVRELPIQFAVHQHESPSFRNLVLGAHPSPKLRPTPPPPLAFEPPMVRDLRGPGFGVLRKLPAAGDVVGVIRLLLIGQGLDTTGMDHALEYWYGQEALEALDVGGLAHGVVHRLKGKGIKIAMAVQMLPQPSASGLESTSTLVDNLTINLRSLSGSSTSDTRSAETELGWELGGRARVELIDRVELDAVTAEYSGSVAWSDSQTLADSVSSYVRIETEGDAQDFTKPVYYVISVRVTRRGTSRLERRYLTDVGLGPVRERPPFRPAALATTAGRTPYLAVISVSHEVLPVEEPPAEQAIKVTTFHQAQLERAREYAPHLRAKGKADGGPKALGFHEFPGPAAGIYPVIAGLPELALGVATMLARAKGKIRADQQITDLIDVPEEISDITSPMFLQAHLVAAASPDGLLVTLEPDEGLLEWINPSETAVRIRLRMYNVGDVNAGTTAQGPRPVEVERYVSNTSLSGQAKGRRSAQAVTLTIGPRVKLGKTEESNQPTGNSGVSSTSSTSDTSPLIEANASARPVNHAAIHFGGRYRRASERDFAGQQGNIQVARATYKQVSKDKWDASRNGPIQFTQTLLLSGGVWLDYELVSTKLTGTVTASVHFMADHAINLLAPVPLARTLFPNQAALALAALTSAPLYETPGRTYIDPESALKLSAVESVAAARVLPAITALLNKHGITDAGRGGDQRSMTRPLRQRLEGRYSESELERRFPQLINGGVVAWIPVRTGFGTLFIGVRVSAEVNPANALEVARRFQTYLMIRTEPTDRVSDVTKRGSSWWGGFTAGAIGVFGSFLGGGIVHGGYQGGSAFESEKVQDRTDFYRITSTSGTYGFTHGLTFKIEVAASWRPPEIFRLPAMGLKWLLLLPGNGELSRASSWFDHAPRAWQEEDKTITGQVTFLVLRELTTPVTAGHGPALLVPASSAETVLDASRWLGAGEAAARRKLVNNELVSLQFIPLSFPAAHLVERLVPWLLAPRLRDGSPAASLEQPRPGFDLGHLRGARTVTSTSAAMLNAKVPAMLRRHGYEFTVSGSQPVTAWLNVNQIRYVDATFVIKDRLYSQNERSETAKVSRSGAFDLQILGETGGLTDRLYESSEGFDFSWEFERGLGGEGGDIHEYDIETTRRFYIISLDVELVMDAGNKGGVTGNVAGAVRLAIPKTELEKLIEIAEIHKIRLDGFPARLPDPDEDRTQLAADQLKYAKDRSALRAARESQHVTAIGAQARFDREAEQLAEDQKALEEAKEREPLRIATTQAQLQLEQEHFDEDLATHARNVETERVAAEREQQRLAELGDGLATDRRQHADDTESARRTAWAKQKNLDRTANDLTRAQQQLAQDRETEEQRGEAELARLAEQERELNRAIERATQGTGRENAQAIDDLHQLRTRTRRQEIERAAQERSRLAPERERLTAPEEELELARVREQERATAAQERLARKQEQLDARQAGLIAARQAETERSETVRRQLADVAERLKADQVRLDARRAREQERAEAEQAVLGRRQTELDTARADLARRREEELQRAQKERERQVTEQQRINDGNKRILDERVREKERVETATRQVDAELDRLEAEELRLADEQARLDALEEEQRDKADDATAQAKEKAQEQARKHRGTERDQRNRWVQRAYRQVIESLGIEEIDVAHDGDCFYNSIRVMFSEELTAINGGTEPTAKRLRTLLANAIDADFQAFNNGNPYRFAAWFPGTTIGTPRQRIMIQQQIVRDIRTPGSWNNDAGDTVAEITARIWRLPITLLGRNYPCDIGPDDPLRRRYLIYIGGRAAQYMGTKPGTGPVHSAANLLAMADVAALGLAPAEPDAEILGLERAAATVDAPSGRSRV